MICCIMILWYIYIYVIHAICVYIYIHIYLFICIRTYIHAYIHTYIHIHVYMCIHIYIYIYITGKKAWDQLPLSVGWRCQVWQETSYVQGLGVCMLIHMHPNASWCADVQGLAPGDASERVSSNSDNNNSNSNSSINDNNNSNVQCVEEVFRRLKRASKYLSGAWMVEISLRGLYIYIYICEYVCVCIYIYIYIYYTHIPV